jgi:hypothetical protein
LKPKDNALPIDLGLVEVDQSEHPEIPIANGPAVSGARHEVIDVMGSVRDFSKFSFF